MYFPFGVKHDPANPKAEEAICRLEKRMQWLNACHQASSLKGHIFGAALYDYAKKIPSGTVEQHGVPTVWELLMQLFTPEQVGKLARDLAPQFSDTLPRLEFPNAVALVDCRFVTTKEWEFLRRYSVGGSEVAAIMGVSHYSTPRQLYHDKKGQIPDVLDVGKEFIFDFGHCVEDYVVEKICSLLGAIHYPEFRMFVHRSYPFISANPDAILMFPDGSLALFEAKTATRHKKDDWYEGIPDYYAPQPQQYLEVLDDPRLEKGYINVVFGGLPSEFKCHMYHRDREMARKQVVQICHFWHEHMEKDIPPPLQGKGKLDLEAVYCAGLPSSMAKEIELAQYTVDDFGLYFDCQEARLKIDKKVKEYQGMASAPMFTDIGLLQPGDLVYIDILDQTLTYEVFGENEAVLPHEIETIHIQKGRDLLTLVTCTPVNVNSHRLLVHCERIAEEREPLPESETLPSEDDSNSVQITTESTAPTADLTDNQKDFSRSESVYLQAYRKNIFLGIGVGLAIVIVVAPVYLLFTRKRKT